MSRKRVLLVLGCGVFAAAIILVQLRLFRSSPQAPPSSRTEPASVHPLNGDHDRRALEAELKKKPDHTPILLRLAELAREAGKPADAAAYLRRVVTIEPQNHEARLELGRALYESGDVQAALAQTSRLVELAPDNTDALYNLGAIYGNLNQIDKARQYMARAVSLAPESNGGKLARAALAKLPQ